MRDNTCNIFVLLHHIWSHKKFGSSLEDGVLNDINRYVNSSRHTITSEKEEAQRKEILSIRYLSVAKNQFLQGYMRHIYELIGTAEECEQRGVEQLLFHNKHNKDSNILRIEDLKITDPTKVCRMLIEGLMCAFYHKVCCPDDNYSHINRLFYLFRWFKQLQDQRGITH